jgi:hypothetical protein
VICLDGIPLWGLEESFRGGWCPATRVGLPVAALLLGVSGLFGGLDHVPLADRVDGVKPGTEVTVEPFTLTINRRSRSTRSATRSARSRLGTT